MQTRELQEGPKGWKISLYYTCNLPICFIATAIQREPGYPKSLFRLSVPTAFLKSIF
jgi:hypothetical protein